MAAKTTKITVYYDAACPKCVKDSRNYEQMAGDSVDDVCWMDITGHDDKLRAWHKPTQGIDRIARQRLKRPDSLGNQCLYSADAPGPPPAPRRLADRAASDSPHCRFFIPSHGEPPLRP